MKSRSTLPIKAANDNTATADAPRVPVGVRRTAAAVAVTVGATAALTAVAAPAGAETPRGKVWNKVAECESGQNWDINTGNGFYGGLQFTDSTWDAHGGEKYAGRADHASREEQIEVARRVLKSQGPGAWPVCGPNAGLSKANGDATSSKLPDKPAEADPTPGSSHTAKHRSLESTTHKTHHKTHHKAHKAKHAKGESYTVHSGDTLSKIARKEHVHGGWKALYKANKSKVHNPNRIHVGQKLHLPS